MFTQRQMFLEKALLSAVALLLLLTTAGQSAVLTTESPSSPLPHSSAVTELHTSSPGGPRVQRSHQPCGDEHSSFCANGGQCMYPQDSDKPSCICTASYGGPRCMLFSDSTRSLPELEQVIGITFGVIMLLFILAIGIYCCVSKRCVKSTPLIKSAPSETSV